MSTSQACCANWLIWVRAAPTSFAGAAPNMISALCSMASPSGQLPPIPTLQRCKFTPVRPTAQLIPAAYDITLNFDRTGGLLMEVEPRRRAHGIPSGLAAEQPVHA